MLSKIITYLTINIWNVSHKNVSGFKYFYITTLRALVLTLKAFKEKECSPKASALTFYTLLSIVPVIAMIFGIAKGFGFETILERQLLENLQGQEEVIKRIIEFAHALIENTKGGLIAGIGVILLFWTVIKLLGNIEDSFNHIWGIVRPRSLSRKFSDYLSAMLLCPLLFIMAGSLTVAVAAQVTLIVDKISLLKTFGPIISASLKLLPYCVIWVLFSFLYIFMPNTKVKLSSGILGGIIAGTIYQVVQWVYIKFQIGLSGYNAVYGGFAALPLFLAWLNTSWTIVFLGAVISFVLQNLNIYEFDPGCLEASHACKRLVALRITQILSKNFQQGEKPLTADDIADRLEIPMRLLQFILHELTASGIVREISMEDDNSIGYQPGRSTDTLTIKYVIDALDRNGSDTIHIVKSTELDEISRRLDSFNTLVSHSPENACLKDI